MPTKEVDIRLGQKSNTWFSANPTLVLLEGQAVYLQGTGKFKMGDGITPLAALPFFGGTPTNIYGGKSPSTIDVNAIPAGTDLSSKTIDNLFENIYAPYVEPTITVNSITPQQEYNAINVSISVSLKWTRGSGAPDLTAVTLQYKRGTDIAWNDLITNTFPSVPSAANVVDCSSTPVIINTGGSNNDTIQFRGLFTDANGVFTSDIFTITFKDYLQAIAALVFSGSSFLNNGKFIRNFSVFVNTVSGTILRQSPNVDLQKYKLQRSLNGIAWGDETADINIVAAGGTLAANGGNFTDNDQPVNGDGYYYRAFVKDTHVPAGAVVGDVTYIPLYNPVFFGMSNAANIAAVDLTTLNIVPNGTGSGQVNYANTNVDKCINGLSFTAANNKFVIAFDDSYGTLSYITDTNTNLNLFPDFTVGTKNVVFGDGTNKTYKVYLFNQVVLDGTYIFNIK